MKEENVERSGYFLRYRRYTEEGEGPKRGMYKVGDVRKITHRYQEYILVTSDYQVTRKHIGDAYDGKTLDCTIVAITQRKKTYGWGGMSFLDAWYKVRDGDGNTFWTTGGHRKWHYIGRGKVTLVDDIQEALWYKMSDKDKMEYLIWEGDMLNFVTRHEVVELE